ncbi:hypothetical protein MBLNU459_g6306t1 [Dothideomycetes sp. NU459]
MNPDLDPDAVADCVLAAFDALPPHRKPRQASSGLKAGRREWVPLAGIVVDSGTDEPPAKRLKCAALATGMKCLPQDRMASLNGNVIHDSHAEILALRAFNRFLLDECADLAAKRMDCSELGFSTVLQWSDPTPAALQGNATEAADQPSSSDRATESLPQSWQEQPFRVKPNVSFHMYCSEAPCGDASMELTMAAQEDATPWAPPPQSPQPSACSGGSTTSSMLGLAPSSVSTDSIDELYGRSYFHAVGVVRRKPSRPDAPPTLSKSCSDKLALKQCTSFLSGVTSMLVNPSNAYLRTLILPKSQYVPAACERAFGPKGRMACMIEGDSQHMGGGYAFRPFQVMTTKREFGFSRRIADSSSTTSLVPSNISTLTFGRTQETLINGVLQGRKQADPKGASAISRRRLWLSALNVARMLVGRASLLNALDRGSYTDVKAANLLSAREAIKEKVRSGPLRGWKRNIGDDQWSL